jgi:hypothetical protein
MTGSMKLNGRAKQQMVAHQRRRISSLPLLRDALRCDTQASNTHSPKNEKKPDGREATGRDLSFRSKLRVCRAAKHGSNAQIIAAYPEQA